ncbi:multifunctional CCA addition/repair protein [Candidatus Spongiihabitans sp.]|uniref:multifunctional CCA addition/repair protein n=1 Tax=Candidatus Spongiihabitans sp. TaxID=3101308 RepID=UPI003C6F422A
MEAYLVGGAVRDQIMGFESKDRDWVVVGATAKKMLKLGFKQVGKNFPVFLHPSTREEYALARAERKTSKGYHGFEFDSHCQITLQQDLQRRDLTMNAMAMDCQGNLIDPFSGQRDIKEKLIRHVSAAFKEDPVRVLRVARFAARYAGKGYRVAADTQEMMVDMVDNGEVDALVAERVWQEMHASFQEKHCAVFFRELRNCGALEKILPEIDALFGVPQTEKYHPEIDTGIHILMCLDAADQLTDNPMNLFAVLLHDLGKALTPISELPSHRGHEKRGLKPIKQLCERLNVPSQYRSFALKVCEFHLHCHRIGQLKATTVMRLLEKLDGFRKPELIGGFALCCLADKRGRCGHEQENHDQVNLLLEYHRAALAVDGGKVANQVRQQASAGNNMGSKITGAKIKAAIRKQRIETIAQVIAKGKLQTAFCPCLS